MLKEKNDYGCYCNVLLHSMTDELQFSINFLSISGTTVLKRCNEVQIYENRDYLCDVVHNDKISEENLVNEICHEK